MSPAADRIREWRADPVQFVREVFGVEPDPWQVKVLTEAGKPGRKRIAMKACAGPGKTAVLAWLGWQRLACYAGRGEHPKGAAVSITADNLRDNLWPELSKWQSRSPFLMAAFKWTKTLVFAVDHPETWFLSARSFAKAADPETVGRALSGLHSEFPFALIDESGDMPVQISKSAEQALGACVDGLLATAGNTTSHTGLLYHVCTHGRSNWYVETITGDPDNPNRASRVDIDWAREQIRLYGRDNPWVMAYVLGEFPPGSINALLTVEEVEAAMGRHLRPDAYEWSQKRLGVDVARFGDDRTVIFPRQGLASFPPVVMRHQRTTDIAARVMQAGDRWAHELEFIDDTGHWGHGVIDNLLAAGRSPIGIQFHGPAIDPRYRNKRAEMWFAMSDWVKRGGALPEIPELVAELTAPTYTLVNGKLMLEDKDMVKKRLGRSPDLADALGLTFAYPDQPASMGYIHPSLAERKNLVEYNPFQED